MLFNSWTFAAFLAIVLPSYYLLPHRLQNRLLLAASYVFYGAWDWRFLGLLAFSTLVDYNLAKAIDSTSNPRRRKLLVSLSITSGLTLLGFFKYWNFFIGSAGALLAAVGLQPNLPTLQIILPVGLSFYTLQTLGYAIDVYRGQQRACRNLLDYAAYVAYFPQLVAGPIERVTRLLPQLQRPRTMTLNMFASGVQLMLWGFVKKIAISDGMAPYVNEIYSNPSAHDGLQLWLGVYGFAIQLYADFSGYTDIARGVSRLFGIELMLNFRQPYFSRNITEFWRRWHISLSTWLRDYLYVPLGGNRGSEFKTYRNLFVTMVASGLWHGAAWTFVIWGALHGIYLAVHRTMIKRGLTVAEAPPPKTAREWLVYVVCAFGTFQLVSVSLIWFRAADIPTVMTYFRGLLTLPYAVDMTALRNSVFVPSFVLYTGIFICLDIPCWYRNRETVFTTENPWLIRSLGYVTALFIISFMREGQGSPYVYFQF